MNLSVVIATNKGFRNVLDLLNSIADQRSYERLDQVIVVANGPMRDQWEKDFSKLSVVPLQVLISEKPGVNAARNLGLAKVTSELALLLDDDCLLKNTDYLCRLVGFHQQYPEAIAVGGSYQLSQKTNPIATAYHVLAKSWQAGDWHQDSESIRLVGGNVSYKMSVLRKIEKWFDERILYGASELEFHLRLKKAGFRCLKIMSLEVSHQPDIDIDSFISKSIRQASNQNLYRFDETSLDNNYYSFSGRRYMRALMCAESQEEYAIIKRLIDLHQWIFHVFENNPEEDANSVYQQAQRLYSSISNEVLL